VEARPDWCISRQRSWGVPIPAFYDAKKTAYLDAGVIAAIADKVAKLGTNAWFNLSAEQLLEGVSLPAGWPSPKELICGRDTLDVWIDSGSTNMATLRNGQGATQWPADLYLEGSDQHRGWFQSSLWCGVIAADAAPYKTVLTHGFIVGEDGKKISKSGQYEKPPTSDNYIKQYGADVIRLWIASQDFTQDITISDKILNSAAEAYRLFRNTFRYQLANLFDFNPATDAVPVEKMNALDRWVLHKTGELIRGCTEAYESYEYHRVQQLCNQFCATTLSAVYHDVIKDRVYTLAESDPLRRSTQTAIHTVLTALTHLLAPVLTFTADEAWNYAHGNKDFTGVCIHLNDWPVVPASWENPALDAQVATLLAVRAKVNEALEPARKSGKVGKSLDALVLISAAPEDEQYHVLSQHKDFLAELFIVSAVELKPASGSIHVEVKTGEELGYVRCPRCWRWVPSLQATQHGEVCPRCAEALR